MGRSCCCNQQVNPYYSYGRGFGGIAPGLLGFGIGLLGASLLGSFGNGSDRDNVNIININTNNRRGYY